MCALPAYASSNSPRSVHRWAYNGRNVLSAAIVEATNIRSSNAVRRTAVSRSGNGSISLTGAYTGDEDRSVDVEIVSGSALTASEPVRTGVGNGALSDLAVLGGAEAQTYTLTLVDLGTETLTASTDLEGVTLEAIPDGVDGNDISIGIDASGLDYTPTDYSLLADLTAGETEALGPGWDWGHPIGTAESVPADALRVVIGDDRSTVYTAWKFYQNAEWHYRFVPNIARTYKAGERVYLVSGSRAVTVTDGTTTAEYPGVVSLNDLLRQLQAFSDLLSFDVVVSNVRAPDNLGEIVDLRTRTDARIDWTSGDGSQYARGFINTVAGANAVTELVTARCYANTALQGAALGGEKWTLKASVSGPLGNLTTGVPYLHPDGRFALTIPTRLPDGYDEAAGDLSGRYSPTSRADGENPAPPVCFDALRLGPGAYDKTITFEYQERTVADCDCENQPWDRLPGADDCLSIDETGETVPTTLGASYAARVHDVQQAYSGWVDANTEMVGGELRTAISDLELFRRVRDALLSTLTNLYTNGRLAWDAWAAATVVDLDYTIQPGNGYLYRCTTGGTTHASVEPTWPTTVGNTVTDNGVVWTCVSKDPEGEFDALLLTVEGEMALLDGVGDYDSVPQWAENTAYSVGDVVEVAQYNTDGTPPLVFHKGKGSYAKCIRAGTSIDTTGFATAETGMYAPGIARSDDYLYDVWLTTPRDSYRGMLILDGSVTWVFLGRPLQSDVDIDDQNPTIGEDLAATTVTTETLVGSKGHSAAVADFVERYLAEAARVLTVAEVPPDFGKANNPRNSGRCWQDELDAYWWVCQDDNYLPIFTNKEYISVKRKAGETEIVPTHEFGLVVKVKCADDLKVGDRITITIGAAGYPSTYQIGDVLTLALVGASPLALTGGQDGDDTRTWTVDRSVDGKTTYDQDPATPTLFSDDNVEFRIHEGGIPSELGDSIAFCLEGGAFRYRLDGGAWSDVTDIGDTDIGDGLTLSFSPGACPSFVPGDGVSFDVVQPYKVGSAMAPDDAALAWTGPGTAITITGAPRLDSIVIGAHTLPNTATIEFSGDYEAVVPWSRGPIVATLPAPLEDATITITIGDAPDAEIGWIWAGETIETFADADTQIRTRRHLTIAGAGANPSRVSIGRGWAFALTWDGFVTAANAAAFVDMLDDVLEQGGEPVCLIPHVDAPEESALVRLGDALELPDLFQYQDDAATPRMHRLALEVNPHYE